MPGLTHTDLVRDLLYTQIANEGEVSEIFGAAQSVAERWVAPRAPGRAATNGLVYGLIQSGKTGVLTATAALGADEGYSVVIILTADINPLYEQTLNRARQAFPAMDVISKREFADTDGLRRRIASGACAVVSTKNAGRLDSLIAAFATAEMGNRAALLVDDEADQASLNTLASRGSFERSAVNDAVANLRGLFRRCTYLQVTATPQALFLQPQGNEFRPSFTVLSNPGADYVGGEDFFGDGSDLVREYDIADIALLTPGAQPAASHVLPESLTTALHTFLVGATYKRMRQPDQNCAFLCHVSTRTSDHRHIEGLLRRYKDQLREGISNGEQRVIQGLRSAYADLGGSCPDLTALPFDDLVRRIGFLSPGISVRTVNGQTDEDVAVHSPYNLFVGGNKLGRGVTIKNLLVSYYGRNPRYPTADTVLQHARMYGYRRPDIGLLRLFLPPELHAAFCAINSLETSLRTLIREAPDSEFRGIYLEDQLRATRPNVLAPGTIGGFVGGNSYNPAQVLRNTPTETAEIDSLVSDIPDRSYAPRDLSDIARVLGLVRPDPSQSAAAWDGDAIRLALRSLTELGFSSGGYIYVDRGRALAAARRETQGVTEGGEAATVPADKPTLFLLRTTATRGAQPAWWPQLRFPRGQYAFAFAVRGAPSAGARAAAGSAT